MLDNYVISNDEHMGTQSHLYVKSLTVNRLISGAMTTTQVYVNTKKVVVKLRWD